jgi:hypothetical protein
MYLQRRNRNITISGFRIPLSIAVLHPIFDRHGYTFEAIVAKDKSGFSFKVMPIPETDDMRMLQEVDHIDANTESPHTFKMSLETYFKDVAVTEHETVNTTHVYK